MAERAVLVRGGRLCLEGIIEEFVPMLPQEDEELGPLDEPQDGLFDRRRIDGWLPQGRTHDRIAFLQRGGPSAEQIALPSSTSLVDYLAGVLARTQIDSSDSRRAQELIITMRDHLKWVVEHRHFALLFELTRELKDAYRCGVEAWTLVKPAVALMGERQLAV